MGRFESRDSHGFLAIIDARFNKLFSFGFRKLRKIIIQVFLTSFLKMKYHASQLDSDSMVNDHCSIKK